MTRHRACLVLLLFACMIPAAAAGTGNSGAAAVIGYTAGNHGETDPCG